MLTSSAIAGGSQLWRIPSVRPQRPRLGLLPDGVAGGRTVGMVRRLFRSDDTFRGYFLPALALAEEQLTQGKAGEVLLLASCWVATGEDRFASAAADRLLNGEITHTPTASYYSNVWEYALAYDWLYHHPLMTEEHRLHIERRIADALAMELEESDGNYPCVWHGRTQLANNILIAALALSLDERSVDFQRRAMSHYAEALRALAITQGWPEGPNYWIHNRAFPFALAADCFMTATGEEALGGLDVRETIRQAAYWQLYILQPDSRFVRLGDCWNGGLARGPGLWQPVQDYYARIARDPGLVAAADYFRTLCGKHYHPGRYGWSAVLAYDPALSMPADYDRSRPAQFLNENLPLSRLFGRRHLGEAYFVERWGDPDAAWVSFKAGDILAHHGHYDQGSFTIHRGSPLAVHSGAYGGYFGAYRLGYFVQTVSKNSILIHAPGEYGRWAREAGCFDQVTGGQRVVMPTGCRIHSVNDWLRELHRGRHYAAGEITAFASEPASFDYIAADITAAYNSTIYAEPGNTAKVSSVVRKLAFLRGPCAVIVGDRVVTTDPRFVTRWLLHTPAKPETERESRAAGESDDNGIFTTHLRWLTMEFQKGKLFHQVLLPEHPMIRKIGGPDYRGYVDREGGGENLRMESVKGEEPPECGVWRTEVIDPVERTEHVFANVLWPRLAADISPAPARLLASDPAALIVAVADWAVVFGFGDAIGGGISYHAPNGITHHLVADLPARSGWRIEHDAGGEHRLASEDGVLSFAAPAGPIRLTPTAPRGGDGHQ